MRIVKKERNTKETRIQATLNLDGTGKSEISTKCGFLDHMLTLFASHGRFDLNLICDGDIEVDYHHTTEDIGILLGELFKEALGEKKGITRYGSMILPMDEALILSAVDISGRAYLNYEVNVPTEKVGDFDAELVQEFFWGFVRKAECTLHVQQLAGENTHHILEGVFKSVARTLKTAVSIDEKLQGEIPSTKGVL